MHLIKMGQLTGSIVDRADRSLDMQTCERSSQTDLVCLPELELYISSDSDIQSDSIVFV